MMILGITNDSLCPPETSFLVGQANIKQILDDRLYNEKLSVQSVVSVGWASPVVQQVKNPPAVQQTQETQVQSLGWEDPLEEEMTTCSSILTWEIPWTEEPDGLQCRVSKSQTQSSN